MEPTDWKEFLLQYKWMPLRQNRELYGIERHDFDNFRRKPEVRAVLDPWRVSAKQPQERLDAILKSAWEYYLTQIVRIDFASSPTSWVPELIPIKNVGKSGFSFFTNSKSINGPRVQLTLWTFKNGDIRTSPSLLLNFSLGANCYEIVQFFRTCSSKHIVLQWRRQMH